MASNECFESMGLDRFTGLMDAKRRVNSHLLIDEAQFRRKLDLKGRGRICLQATYFDDDEAIGPQDLKLLHDVMVELCQGAGIDTASTQASALASNLVGLYKSGFRSRPELIFMAADGDRDFPDTSAAW